MFCKSIFVIMFSFLIISCSKSNVTSSAMTYPIKQDGQSAWLKIKYDIDNNGQVTNIELIDSYKASNKIRTDTINVMKKWKFSSGDAKNGHITEIYFRPTPPSK